MYKSMFYIDNVMKCREMKNGVSITSRILNEKHL